VTTRRHKPNVIVCLCDQLRAFDVGCYGSSFVRTPNMDKLASQGVRFDVACSNNPVCTPGRSILLSGQYSRTCTGSLINVGEPEPDRKVFAGPTLAEAFKSAGYRTGLIGKWHIEPHPRCLGFDSAFFPHHSHRYTGQTYFDINGGRRVVTGFSPDAEADELARFIESARGKPFFAFYNISQPHMPLADMPDRYKAMYAPAEVPLRSNVLHDGAPAHDERWFLIYLWDYLYYEKHLADTLTLPDGFDLRALTALYDGSVSWADDQLGELMQGLASAGLDENTIVVFTSDHGDNLGSHQLFNKDQLYEESIRIPLIFRWPGALAPRAIDTHIASLVDAMPTLLSLAGVDVPGSVQGTDLASVISGDEATVGENAAFIETSGGDVGIRTPTHLYGIKKAKDGRHRASDVIDDRRMFFDLARDPQQMQNLAAEPSAVADELRERVLRWDRQTAWLSAQ
jgi:arylsulfatase A-like enzyme